MTPLRTAALVLLFTLAALSTVATFVEAYGAWRYRTSIVGQCLVCLLKRSGISPVRVRPSMPSRSTISSICSTVIEPSLRWA
jgi:hypothetical protein